MKITVCIGSSSHLKGSRQIVEGLQNLVEQHHLGDKIELAGAFCMGKCSGDVSVTVDDAFFSVKPENLETFFNENVLAKLA